jgi:hypothetical protein
VQQPCSNPSKSPERLRKTQTQKCGDFQQFCTHLKTPANLRGALAWRRTRVRVSSGPLRKGSVLQVKCRERITGSTGIRPLYSYRAATRVNASICRHFVRVRDVQQPITLPSHGSCRWFDRVSPTVKASFCSKNASARRRSGLTLDFSTPVR